MLIQITNRCRMMCPHCMDASVPDGGLMDEATFGNVVRFLSENECVHVTISGGEPTEHPLLMDFCKRCSRKNIRFSLASNGMWLGDEKKEWAVERIAKLGGFMGMQVYTNPKWYRLHEETVRLYNAQRTRWERLEVMLDDHDDIRAMCDIGRAKTCEKAIAETRASKWHNICLSAHVTAVQTSSMKQFLGMMLRQARFCSPMIDWRGDFHASESWLCQSFGNVNRDSSQVLFENLKKGRPCGGCIPCQRYLTETDPKMAQARALLGQ